MATWNPSELHTEIALVYAAQLSVPPWWPPEQRTAFIEQHASEAANLLIVELDDIADRVADRDALLAEARGFVMWDLTDAIAEHSAFLTAEAHFTHPRWRQSRTIRRKAASLCAVSARLQCDDK